MSRFIHKNLSLKYNNNIESKGVNVIKLNTASPEYLEASFRALTDALLPSKPVIKFPGSPSASDMYAHEYIIYELNHYVTIQKQFFQKPIPLAKPTALLLEAAAEQLVKAEQVQSQQSLFPGGGMFSCLSRDDRIRTLSALENLKLDLYLLPSPYQNNAGLIKYVVDALNRFAMFGYYSEWPAYGTTRLYPPNDRRLEFFPWTWQQIGYPGVSFGYRDFRGFLLKMDRNEAEE